MKTMIYEIVTFGRQPSCGDARFSDQWRVRHLDWEAVNFQHGYITWNRSTGQVIDRRS
jgi:hypothetical protein